MVEQLWARPANATLSLEEWRWAASAAERLPPPSGLRTSPVDAGGIEAEWSWFDDVDDPADDCAVAYRWLLDQGVAPGRVAFFGDSAGGNLCVTAALAARAKGCPLPGAMVLASPAPDLTFRGPSNTTNRDVDPFSRIDNPPRMLEYYLQGADPTDPLASPVFADLSGFPPMLILVGPEETHVDDSRALAERAAEFGVDVTFELVEAGISHLVGIRGGGPRGGPINRPHRSLHRRAARREAPVTARWAPPRAGSWRAHIWAPRPATGHAVKGCTPGR